MKKTIKIALCIVMLLGSTFSQVKETTDLALKTVELHSPWIRIGEKTVRHDPELHKKSCFDLVLLERSCGRGHKLSYGNRIGANWDIFAIQGGRTRMIDIGQHAWTDNITLPEVEPWAELQPGEGRSITINASGADGRNADGTYGRERTKTSSGHADKPLAHQVSSSIIMSGKVIRPDVYNPFTEVKKGHMYLIHVVDTKDDFYVILRAEDVVLGTKVTLSYWKWEPSKSIF